ncbi:MAG TPA: MipA/OmpV family protein [Cellvibrio sp.]|nr:MipA/OmpV family protein [Cellvibrio sp.]
MKSLANLIAVFSLVTSCHAAALSKDEAQKIVDRLHPEAKATELRELYRDGKRAYEIEYLFLGEEYEAIVTADGAVLENYKDTGASGRGLPLIVSLALAQESDIYRDQSQTLEVIPVVIGNYGHFWFKGLRHGYSLYSHAAFTFSPMIKINPDDGYQVSDADHDSNLYLGLEDTEVTVEAGTQFLFDINALQIEINLLADITGGHKGALAELSFSKPQHLGSLLLIPSLTFTYSDKKVANYYFGIADDLATPFRPAFATGSLLDTEISATFIWNMMGRWYLIGDLSYKFYDEKLEDSPLLDSTYQASGFIGIGYSF